MGWFLYNIGLRHEKVKVIEWKLTSIRKEYGNYKSWYQKVIMY